MEKCKSKVQDTVGGKREKKVRGRREKEEKALTSDFLSCSRMKH